MTSLRSSLCQSYLVPSVLTFFGLSLFNLHLYSMFSYQHFPPDCSFSSPPSFFLCCLYGPFIYFVHWRISYFYEHLCLLQAVSPPRQHVAMHNSQAGQGMLVLPLLLARERFGKRLRGALGSEGASFFSPFPTLPICTPGNAPFCFSWHHRLALPSRLRLLPHYVPVTKEKQRLGSLHIAEGAPLALTLSLF